MKNLFTKTLSLLGACCLALALPAHADEGMWLPQLLKQYNEPAMRNMGLKLTADQIYSVNQGSMKDGVVLFGGGCTGEIISNEGLLLTNHHCGYGSIQRHSSVKNDYLTNGFWSMERGAELPNAGLTATFIIRIEDVSQQALAGTAGMPEDQRRMVINANLKKIEEEAVRGTHYEAEAMPFFYGTEYYLFVKEVFKDVRLVGAPPSSIGKFGGDTDNWMWPRHTGDFSLFRIYAGPDNKPAPYNAANKPLKPRHHFPISLAGVKPGDFTMVYGFPGRTQVYLTSFAVDMIRNKVNEPKIKLREERLKIMDRHMKRSDTIRIQYSAKYASLANYWKKWLGENRGIDRLDAIGKKRKLEQEFTKWVAADAGRQSKYGAVLPELQRLYKELEDVILAVDYQREAVLGAEAFYVASSATNLVKAIKEKKDAEKAAAALSNSQKNLFKDFNRNVDREQFALVMQRYIKDVPASQHPKALKDAQALVTKKYKGDWEAYARYVYSNSAFLDTARTRKLAQESVKKGDTRKLEADPLYVLFNGFGAVYNETLVPKYLGIARQIELQNRLWVQGQREMQPSKAFYPDANSTLRVAYGQVKPYQPQDGVTYTHYTTLSGVMQKEDSTVEEFVVPARLKELYQKKDYGQYGVNGEMPLAFIASNHTTGGNSGSPVFNAQGQLIGTNFDRCWEGTMSDIVYDADQCRNITLDIRYTLFVIDKYAGAGHLVKEMTLVK